MSETPSIHIVEPYSSVPSPSVRSTSPNRSLVSTISVASSATVSASQDFFPNFTIPRKWRPSIMSSIDNKQLTPDIRNEIVRDLVTHMYGYMEKPTSSFCKFVAQRLILLYTFMRDSKGTGYVSVAPCSWLGVLN